MKKPALMKESPLYMKFIAFGLVILITFIFTMLLGTLIALPFYGKGILGNLSNLNDISNLNNIDFLKYYQIVNQLGLFIFPSIIFAFIVNRNVYSYLKIDKTADLFSFIASGIIILLSLPLVNWMAEINSTIRLPEAFSGIEKWMKYSEGQADQLTEVFLKVNTTRGFIVNLFMIAIIPAVGEEFFFRGVLLRLFNEGLKNIHLSILLTAIIFSALHIQFYSFLPRMMLGILFGYLLVWTGSLWVPIFAHFINNAIAVIVVFLANKGIIKTDLNSFGNADNNIILILSCFIVSTLIAMIYIKERNGKIKNKI